MPAGYSVVEAEEASGEMVAKGKVAGATAWMVKLFKPEGLLAAADKLVHRASSLLARAP